VDPRIQQLAKGLVHFSVKAEAGDKVLIEGRGNYTRPLIQALVRECIKVGALPFVETTDPVITRELVRADNDEMFALKDYFALERMKQMDCYIGIGSPDNMNELSDLPGELMARYNKFSLPSLKQRVDHTRWVVLRYPNPGLAQSAKMSQEGFEDFYFNVCNLDYSKMDQAMVALQDLMERTDQVRLTGPDYDLSFSIKGIPVIRCAGELNIPDGEIYTAPVRDSVNGTIRYNTPSNYLGFTFEDVRFTFQDGKIVEATANDSEKLNQVLDTDEGARFIGEFAIGVNPYIEQPMLDTLFDEKIKGSFHFTPGSSYDNASNGNQSAVHWDLVAIQRQDYGGGEMYFDDVLVRNNGIFVLPELDALNPENLI